ncbi:Fic family protein [Microbacterium sp. VKM Ac-2923]|uniref:Fic family protein n=1 Tax=Microbacterium sp. VKM Ac-2923 TaxID=2929476 RepID=UPI001FB34553|nr:Fic family protein [Microbacterium sp. VKM Ac-2923]MCJ1706188.1 Fic family protein [Microbacterium sp. VKM Ac-2923]
MLNPAYGETPLDADEADALTSTARAMLGDDPDKADVYAIEQDISDEVGIVLLQEILDGGLGLTEMFDDQFVRRLHRTLYGDIWQWAGTYRLTEKSVGIDPAYIAVELRQSLDSIAYRWSHTNDWSPRELGIAVHAEVVRIHPFVDGNGRATRLLADLVHTAAQGESDSFFVYDWDVDKRAYIDLLRSYDVSRNSGPLAAFIPVTEVFD